jgi:hydrogenase nickel incorporation protein HypB
MEIKILKNILGANDQIAAKNRELMAKHEVFAVNIMASPGAGKTSVVLQTIRALKNKTRIGVIEGDIASSIDAETVAKEGRPRGANQYRRRMPSGVISDTECPE